MLSWRSAVGKGARLHQQRLEADEHLSRHDLEPALCFIGGVERIHGIPQCLDPVEAGRALKPDRVEAEGPQVVLGGLDRLEQRRHQFLDRGHDGAPVAVVLSPDGILRERLAQAPEHAVVVHDDAAILARIDAVGAGDSLHEAVGLHRLVDIERRQALHVEAGQPHGTHNGDAEGMLRDP